MKFLEFLFVKALAVVVFCVIGLLNLFGLVICGVFGSLGFLLQLTGWKIFQPIKHTYYE
jgi:hypothetical protein